MIAKTSFKGMVGVYKTNHAGKILEYVLRGNTVLLEMKRDAIARLVSTGTLQQINQVRFCSAANSTAVIASPAPAATASASGGSTATGSFSAAFTAANNNISVSAIYAIGGGSVAYLSSSVSTVLNSGDSLGIRWSITAS